MLVLTSESKLSLHVNHVQIFFSIFLKLWKYECILEKVLSDWRNLFSVSKLCNLKTFEHNWWNCTILNGPVDFCWPKISLFIYFHGITTPL
jgi:hypothetical protein